MITTRVQNLFDFIDWLHSQTDYFLSQQQLVDELNEIRAEQNKLSPTKHYKDREKFDSLQKELLEKFAVIETRIIKPIHEKIKFYDVTDISTPIVNLNALGELLELQRKYDENDLEKIQKAKYQYIIYRIKTRWQPYFSFGLFFSDLDRELYEYFKFFEEDNEVEYISDKAIKVENLEEAVQLFTGKAVFQNINFDTFTDFLEYYKREVQDLVLEPGAKRVVDRYNAKFETATFQSEIEEVEQFAEKSVKELKGMLFNLFNGESYKTKVIGSVPRFYHIVKCLVEYEKMYAAALNYKQKDIKGLNGSRAEQHSFNKIEVSASLKPEVVEPLFNILKDFFEKEQQDSFKTILETFENSPKKLLFKANGNRLADTYKRLIETDLITGMQKKDLINFIAANFNFYYRGEVKEFKIKTLEQTISETLNPCKNPIIDIVKGEVIKK